MRDRGEAMMIYNVSPVKGISFCPLSKVQSRLIPDFIAPSQAEKRQEILAMRVSREANEQVQWIWAGMLIELEQ